jgi:hypothetical protein
VDLVHDLNFGFGFQGVVCEHLAVLHELGVLVGRFCCFLVGFGFGDWLLGFWFDCGRSGYGVGLG